MSRPREPAPSRPDGAARRRSGVGGRAAVAPDASGVVAELPVTTGASARAGPRAALPLRRAQIVGLALLGTGPALSALVELAVFGRDGLRGLLYAAPLVVAALLAALLVRRAGAWARLAGVVVAGLHVLAYADVLADVTTYRASALDLAPLTAVALGGALAVAAGAGALALRTPGPVEALERWAVRLTVGAVLLVTLASGLLTVLGGESVDEAAARFAVGVDLVDFTFAPATLEVGRDGRLLVHNADPVLHTFTVPALGIDRALRPGGDALIDLRGVAPGTWAVYCKPHADVTQPDPARAGMAAWLAVG